MITLGDEFQALFHGEDHGVRAAMALMASTIELTRPTAVRFGLGIGPLTTALQEQTLGMDGPCFHRARQALDRARGADLLCQLEHEGETQEVLWSTLAALVDAGHGQDAEHGFGRVRPRRGHRRFEQDPDFAEYFLVGTLISLLMAVAVAEGLRTV